MQTFTITTNPLVDVIPGCYDYFVTADGDKVDHFSVATDGDESILTVTYTPTNNDVLNDFDQVETKYYGIKAFLKTPEDDKELYSSSKKFELKIECKNKVMTLSPDYSSLTTDTDGRLVIVQGESVTLPVTTTLSPSLPACWNLEDV